MWTCSKCGEHIAEDHFAVCWKCSSPRDGAEEDSVEKSDTELDKSEPTQTTLDSQLESAKAQRNTTAIFLAVNIVVVVILLAMGRTNAALFGVVATVVISVGLASQNAKIIVLEAKLENQRQ